MATFFLESGDLANGRALLKKILAVLTRTQGPAHPETIAVAFHLAAVYHAMEKYNKAEKLYRRALAVWEEVLGPDNLRLAEVREKYAELLHQTNRAEQAEEMASRARAIRSRQAGKES